MALTRKSRTAMDVLKSNIEYISTYSKKIDDMLNGGIRIGVITELCGNPGSGKSNLCTQLCISVQMKYGVTSNETGTVIYIDTEGSFVPIRLQNMAMAAENHYKNENKNSINTNSIEQLLKNVTYFRCINVAELIACLIQLKQIMTPERNVKLIILDSLAHPIRSIIDGDHLTRHKYIVRIVTMLQKLASENNCAVVIVNHMIAKVESQKNEAYCAPALGDAFGHMSQLRLQLSWKMNKREARVLKSPHIAELSTFFQITDDGIRDIDETESMDDSDYNSASQENIHAISNM
ncbi:unnamed protein product [Rotaria sordida]|uniref:DNA repair protein RAD51 homolog 3 n=1 Tax=Rotaria sordida TaxID=392033 RepID=A0A813S5X6_9BILA|nr:unnamed protein product [Rotaria sordida]CAF3550121.1 unnamed protein product [Rotaria sordida]